jgi:hypothetical protein
MTTKFPDITTTTTTSTTTTTTTSKPISDQNINKTIEVLCTDGWSAWIKVNQLKSKSLTKFEYMPTFEDLISIEHDGKVGLKNNVRT